MLDNSCSVEERKEYTKQIRTSRRRDREEAIFKTLPNDLDLRDQWLGIRKLKIKIRTTYLL